MVIRPSMADAGTRTDPEVGHSHGISGTVCHFASAVRLVVVPSIPRDGVSASFSRMSRVHCSCAIQEVLRVTRFPDLQGHS